MAYLDDRFWCHRKIVGLTDRAFRVYVCSITYAAGMGTKGNLSEAQQRIISSLPRVRTELLQAGLWDANGAGKDVKIHDWDAHNALRDERRKRDRERKRAARLSEGKGADSPQDTSRTSSGQNADTEDSVLGKERGQACVEGLKEEPLKAKQRQEQDQDLGSLPASVAVARATLEALVERNAATRAQLGYPPETGEPLTSTPLTESAGGVLAGLGNATQQNQAPKGEAA